MARSPRPEDRPGKQSRSRANPQEQPDFLATVSDFAADLIVGEWDRAEYCLVEFEDARQNSIFEQVGKKATREWGKRFDHGYSQIIDWAHKLDDRSASADCLARFGQREIRFEAVLVIGRSVHLDAAEEQRLRWRTDNVAINTKKVACMTFDDLLDQFSVRLRVLSTVEASVIAKSGTTATGVLPPSP